MPFTELPDVGRIQGIRFEPGPTPKQSRISLQWTDVANPDAWYQVWIPFLDAMYLLNLLRHLQRDVEFQMPEDPSGRGLYDPRGR